MDRNTGRFVDGARSGKIGRDWTRINVDKYGEEDDGESL